MCSIYFNNDNIYEGDIENTLLELNEILTLFKTNIKIIKNFTWKIKGNIIEFKHSGQNLKEYILYFLVHNIDCKDNKKLTNIDTCTITNLIMYDGITNIFILLNSLGYSKIDYYQAFIYYLNKTISKSKLIKQPNLNKICDNFIRGRIESSDQSFGNILLYYIKKKKLMFNITYTPFIKIENNIF